MGETTTTPWGTEETLRQRMTRLLGEAHACADNRDLGGAALNASAAIEAWQEAGSPDWAAGDEER